jgi:hypothetical protein
MKTRIAIATFGLAIANFAWAQSPSNNTTNFPMIGLVRGQTLQVNLVAYPVDPCFATIGFQNANGNPVGPTLNVALQAGQSASLALNGNTLTNTPGQRVEVLPTVTLTVGVASQCDASAEVYDNILEISSVVVPGVAGWPPNPIFGMFGLTELQTARLNVVAYPPDPCIGMLSFVNSNGVQGGKRDECATGTGPGDVPGVAGKHAGHQAGTTRRSAAGRLCVEWRLHSVGRSVCQRAGNHFDFLST